MLKSRITHEAIYKGLPLLRQEAYDTIGYYEDILEAIYERITYMADSNSKVLMARLDVRFPVDINASSDNKCFQYFIETYIRHLKDQSSIKDSSKRKYFHPQYVWTREQYNSDNHHYHLLLLLNANAIQYFKGVQQMTSYWANSLKKFHDYQGNTQGCIYHCKNTSGYSIRFDKDSPALIAAAFQTASYLAKVHTKDNNLKNNNSWSCSRLNLQTKGSTMILDFDQKRAVKLAEESRNMFITGGAGTGKSFLIKKIAEALSNTDRQVILLAPTGMAAFNVEGETIHSFFRFTDGVLDEDNTGIKTSWDRKMFQYVDTLIIDEVSMVRSDTFAAIDRIMKLAMDSKEPFGGKQVIVVGDFYQLPPVVPVKKDNRVIADYLNEKYNGPYAFQTEAWKQADFMPLFLSNKYRQDDPGFLKMLDALRLYNDNAMDAIKFLNDHVRNNKILKPSESPEINICSRNEIVREINQAYLDIIRGAEDVFDAEDSGEIEDNFPIKPRLRIKKGARVMILKNGVNCHNGSLGHVIGYDEEQIKVKLDSGTIVNKQRHEYEYKEYELQNDKIVPVVKGKRRQFPVALGYAISIHKSQGMGFDKVNIILGEGGCFSYGQLYTAISRVKTLQGLRLKNMVNLRDAFPCDDVKDFYASLNINKHLSS